MAIFTQEITVKGKALSGKIKDGHFMLYTLLQQSTEKLLPPQPVKNITYTFEQLDTLINELEEVRDRMLQEEKN